MRKYIYPVYMNEDGNPSTKSITKSTTHVEANANTQKENQKQSKQ
jgi:hypothetical protein